MSEGSKRTRVRGPSIGKESHNLKTTTTNLIRLPFAASLLLLGCITGCATDNSADLRLTCVESKKAYSQQFPDAYVSKGADGDTEVVLVSDAKAADTGADVRQVMHVKVLWRPQKGTKQSHPSYTNAALHWYVFNENPAGGSAAPDVLEYTGAGFVTLADAAGGTQVTIRNATLKPSATENGSLSDPVGPARLTGTFVAKRSAKRVNDLLAEVKHATDGARAQQASAR